MSKEIEKQRVDSRWVRHIKDGTDKAKVIETLGNNNFVITELQRILLEELKSKETTSTEDYKIPNWDCYQADRNGYIRAIKSFLSLLNYKED